MPQSNRPGDLLAGRYRLVDLLSESGGGRFWRAQDDVLERDVALHVIAEDDPRAEELLDAARRSAVVLDPRILRVLDADVRDGLCFVVNEWGAGTSLDIMLAAGGALGPRAAAWLVSEVATAVATAHAAGVPHGRLNPEAVLVDRTGSIRLIGLCVDAALHGTGSGTMNGDVNDLAGLLYAALTGRWAGLSGSAVASAPQEHGRVLRPRQVRAGVPRALDEVCDELLNPYGTARGMRGLDTARGVADALADFVGDPTGLERSLVARLVSRGDETVSFSSVPEFALRDTSSGTWPRVEAPLAEPPAHRADVPATTAADATEAVTDALAAQLDDPLSDPLPARLPDPEVTEALDSDAVTGEVPAVPGTTGAGSADPPAVTDLPTEAGLPIFGEDDDVSWLAAPGTPPAPPPPFVEPPARPLFADTSERRARPHAVAAAAADARDFWPFESSATGAGLPPVDDEVEDDGSRVPGRRWLRVAGGLLAALLLLLTVVVAVNLVRGRSPLGAVDDPSPSASPSASSTPAAVLTGLTARDFDPEGDPASENPEQAPLAVDGKAGTGWRTLTYDQDLGAGGLKSGVGLVVDLGATRTVTSVALTLGGQPTAVALYLSDSAPTTVDGLTPIAEGRLGRSGTLTPGSTARGRYLVVWLTSLPAADGGFRGEVDEVSVRGR